MLDRNVVKELLEAEFRERRIKIPKGISKMSLTETFCQFTEDDYYEWIKDNFKTFFDHGTPDWNWIRGRISHYLKI